MELRGFCTVYTVSGLQLWQWRREAKRSIRSTDISDEVDWLLQEFAGLDRLSLRLESFRSQPQIELKIPFEQLQQLWQRRLKEFIPIQYLAGVTPWRNFELEVSPAVLIPRPETELLIDLAIAQVQQTPTLQTGHWADLGTGSGAIAIALSKMFPSAIVHAVDQNESALAVARSNADRLKAQIHFYRGSWFDPLTHLKGDLAAMVSNPPYIPTQTLEELQPEVRLHEPRSALDGGIDGLDCIRHLVQTAPDYLQSNGLWMIEMMSGQAAAVVQLLQSQGSYTQIEIHSDLAGIERFALARRK